MKNPRVEAHLAKIRSRETPYSIHRCGVTLEIWDQVYPTSEVSELMVECMDDPFLTGSLNKNKRVLDYGTGAGFLAIQAALRGADVVALDLNSTAISCARLNAKKNGLENKIDFRISRNLDALRDDEKFDFIFAGLPWDDAKPCDSLESAFYDENFEMRKNLFDRASTLLKEDGKIFLTYSATAEERNPLNDPWFRFQRVKERIINDELHFVIMLMPN